MIIDPKDLLAQGESKFTPIPPGTYEANVFQVEVRTAHNGNQYLSWQFKIAEGPYQGKSVFTNTSMSKNALWRLRQFFEAIRFEYPTDKPFELDVKDLVGRTCRITVKHEEYEGRINAVVDRIDQSERRSAKVAVGALEQEDSDLPDDLPF